ncbi:MAG: putative Fatty acid synthase subunit beta, partial [Streblomastix strix]
TIENVVVQVKGIQNDEKTQVRKKDKDQDKKKERSKETKKQRPLTAYLFTGQSGLKKGVGMDLYEQYDFAKKIWDECDTYFLNELGISLLKIVRENPAEYVIDFNDGEKGALLRQKYINLTLTQDEEVIQQMSKQGISVRAFPEVGIDTPCYIYRSPHGLLRMTHFAQPIIVVYEYVALQCLQLNRKKKSQSKSSVVAEEEKDRLIFCGHSLGEYCALVALGEIASAAEMAMICFVRGMVMQSCVERDPITHISPYGMAAVSPSRVANWFKADDLKQVISNVVDATSGRLLEIVNYNVFGDQYVVSGERYTIWLLGKVLSWVGEQGQLSMSQLSRFCFNLVATTPHSSTPLDVPKTNAVLPLQGIDIPFHSRQLRSVVPLFRSFLEGRLPSADTFSYAKQLDGRYITNVYSKELFTITVPFARQLLQITNSPYLKELLGHYQNDDKSDEGNEKVGEEQGALWDVLTPNERGRLLLRETLSYQFASAVQWIDTQLTILQHGFRRIVEIGPTKTLASMFAKTLQRLPDQVQDGNEIHNELISEASKIKQGGQINGALSAVEILSFETDREELEFIGNDNCDEHSDADEDD